ncbi:hypothetical protein ACVLD2_000987 [Paenibacillus sp. PvR052]|nr:hypothetical protein [Paenibacillus sp. PvP091]MBP1169509.1 hypothetical protein [Paenibacillus sp. PvR098]MBP2440537.1 hypothetical protein [Paenibacillus sp. PvP052]
MSALSLRFKFYANPLLADHSDLVRRVSWGRVRPWFESSISVLRRLSLVSSFFALMTHQIAAL